MEFPKLWFNWTIHSLAIAPTHIPIQSNSTIMLHILSIQNADLHLPCMFGEWKEIIALMCVHVSVSGDRMKEKKAHLGNYESYFLRYLNSQSNGQAQMSEINWYLFQHIFYFENHFISEIMVSLICIHIYKLFLSFVCRLCLVFVLHTWCAILRTHELFQSTVHLYSAQIVPLCC